MRLLVLRQWPLGLKQPRQCQLWTIQNFETKTGNLEYIPGNILMLMKCDSSNRRPEAPSNENGYDPSRGESRTFPEIVFREAVIDQEPVPPDRHKQSSPSPTAKVFGDSEDHDVAWVPKSLAKLLSDYAPSADSAIIDSVVRVATHMLRKH